MPNVISNLTIDEQREVLENVQKALETERAHLRKKLAALRVKINRNKKNIAALDQLELNLVGINNA